MCDRRRDGALQSGVEATCTTDHDWRKVGIGGRPGDGRKVSIANRGTDADCIRYVDILGYQEVLPIGLIRWAQSLAGTRLAVGNEINERLVRTRGTVTPIVHDRADRCVVVSTPIRTESVNVGLCGCRVGPWIAGRRVDGGVA